MIGPLIIKIFAFIFFFSSTAFGQDYAQCKKFQVSFSKPINISFDGVFHGGNKIGKIINTEKKDLYKNNVHICIDYKHSSKIEKNTVTYISDSSIIVYNVWASGEDIPEHSTVPGFTSKFSLFWYEIKLLFKIIFN